MSNEPPIQNAFTTLLEAIAAKVAQSAARRARGEITEDEHVNFVLWTMQTIAPHARMSLQPGAFVSPTAPCPEAPRNTPTHDDDRTSQREDAPALARTGLREPQLPEWSHPDPEPLLTGAKMPPDSPDTENAYSASPPESESPEIPLIVDQEWEPSSDDLFPDLPPYTETPSALPRDTAPQEKDSSQRGATTPVPFQQHETPEEIPATKPLPVPHPPGPTTEIPSQERTGRNYPGRASRVIVSGTLPWEQASPPPPLEDAMFRFGVSEDLATRILQPENELAQKDRNYIADEARKRLEELRKNKNPAGAFALSFLLPGVGNMYAGATIAGFIFLIPALACIVMTILDILPLVPTAIGYVMGGIISALTAVMSANEANSRIHRQQQQAKTPHPQETSFNLLTKTNRQ
ncbi:MAG: hypothetical protein KKE73_00225 [Proteobacteria bacterium]|nr:hypothetical protein [Pseudomonadota bacterium]